MFTTLVHILNLQQPKRPPLRENKMSSYTGYSSYTSGSGSGSGSGSSGSSSSLEVQRLRDP